MSDFLVTPSYDALANLNAVVPPTVNDDISLGYIPGSLWIDNVASAAYVAVNTNLGAAVWNPFGGSGGKVVGYRSNRLTSVKSTSSTAFPPTAVLHSLLYTKQQAGTDLIVELTFAGVLTGTATYVDMIAYYDTTNYSDGAINTQSLNDFLSGTISFPFTGVPVGVHTFGVKFAVGAGGATFTITPSNAIQGANLKIWEVDPT